jgi:signal peptidase I
MTELSLYPTSSPSESSRSSQTPNRWKRPLIATLLSLLAPGLGQLYNRQFWKAICVGLTGPAVYIPAGHLGAFRSFRPFSAIVLSLLLWQLGFASEALLTAHRQSLSLALSSLPLWKWIVGIALILAPPTLLPGESVMEATFRVRAYKVPSASNCPTVCQGERMIVDPFAYKKKTPQRGDLIMFKHPEFDSLLFKRVVGVPGDIVAQSPNGILVNGKAAALVDLTHVCGNPPLPGRAEVPVDSRSEAVPPDSLYVVGDNWSDSLDSRFEQFGFVSIKNVRGQPLFLYWSPYQNRIGCRVQ